MGDGYLVTWVNSFSDMRQYLASQESPTPNRMPSVSDVNPIVESAPSTRNSPPKQPDSSEILLAASGSGFAVTEAGYLVTNNHVIEGCENVKVHNQGKMIEATVISRNPANDLAVIKADFKPEAVFALKETNPLLVQEIYVAGYPFDENLSSSVKITKGIVGLNR